MKDDWDRLYDGVPSSLNCGLKHSNYDFCISLPPLPALGVDMLHVCKPWDAEIPKS